MSEQNKTPAEGTAEQTVSRLTALVMEKFPGAVTEHHTHRGDETITVKREQALEVFTFLRDDPTTAFNLFADLTAVDYLGRRDVRFEVVTHLKSLKHGHRIRVKVQVPENDCWCEAITPLWNGANWYERECYDMYGITFRGHPDLRRVILYDSFVGHPLRKDYDKYLQQPRVPMRVVRERYDYHTRTLTDPSETERRPL